MKWVYLVTYSCTFAFPLLQINLLQQIRAIKASAKIFQHFFSHQQSASKLNSSFSFPCCQNGGKKYMVYNFYSFTLGLCCSSAHVTWSNTHIHSGAEWFVVRGFSCRSVPRARQADSTLCHFLWMMWPGGRCLAPQQYVRTLSLTRAALKFHHQNGILYGWEILQSVCLASQVGKWTPGNNYISVLIPYPYTVGEGDIKIVIWLCFEFQCSSAGTYGCYK